MPDPKDDKFLVALNGRAGDRYRDADLLDSTLGAKTVISPADYLKVIPSSGLAHSARFVIPIAASGTAFVSATYCSKWCGAPVNLVKLT